MKSYEMLISSLLSSGLTSNIADFFKLMGFKFSTDIKWKYIDKGQIMMERKSGLMKDLKSYRPTVMNLDACVMMSTIIFLPERF